MPANLDCIKKVMGSLDYVDLTKKYPKRLPKELEDYYVYSKTNGHSILSVIEGLPFRNEPEKSCKLVPVKSALRHYWTDENGWVVVPLEYVTCPNGPMAIPNNPSDIEL